MLEREVTSDCAEEGDERSIGSNSVGRDFIATCYEIFLGRQIDDLSVANERGRWPLEEALPSITTSDEFVLNVYQPLHNNTALRTGHDRSGPSVRQRVWIIDALPISAFASAVLCDAPNWPELLTGLLSDPKLCQMAGLPPLPNGFCGRGWLAPEQPPAHPNTDLPLARLAGPADVARAVALWRKRITITDVKDSLDRIRT